MRAERRSDGPNPSPAPRLTAAPLPASQAPAFEREAGRSQALRPVFILPTPPTGQSGQGAERAQEGQSAEPPQAEAIFSCWGGGVPINNTSRAGRPERLPGARPDAGRPGPPGPARPLDRPPRCGGWPTTRTLVPARRAPPPRLRRAGTRV